MYGIDNRYRKVCGQPIDMILPYSRVESSVFEAIAIVERESQ